jgi:predicted dehydrogenase
MAVTDWGIGLIGLGGIAHQHLTAYQAEGFRVVGGTDPSSEARARIAGRFGIPVFETLEELLALEEMRVADIAAPHRMEIRRPIVEAAARAGKALFVQKPLMPSLAEARELVEIAEGAGAPLMVNQNSVFVPAYRAIEPFLSAESGIGPVYYFEINNRGWVDMSGHPWYGKVERWVTSDMAVHHFALAHHWFGPAESVTALLLHDPTHTDVIGDTVSTLLLRFHSGTEGLIVNNWSYRGPLRRHHPGEEVILQGPGGAISGDTTAMVVTRADGTEERPAVSGPWFPDAFRGSMCHFLEALDSGQPFLCSGRDNLRVVGIIEAAYRSAAERRTVELAEFGL